MNVITFPTGTITDSTLVDGTIQMRQNLIGAELEMDSFTFHAFSARDLDPYLYLADRDGNLLETSDGKLIMVKNMTEDPTQDNYYGMTAVYTFDGELIGKYYVDSVEKVGPKLYYFTCHSVIGLLENRTHYGGVYPPDVSTTTTVGDILPEIMGDIPYSADSDVLDAEIRGWLPIDTARQNLMHVLFAIGAIVVKDADGDPYFKYPDTGQASQINQSSMATGGSVKAIKTATEVQVTEHTYLEDYEERLVLLYDNTDMALAADHEVVTFDKPYYDLYSPDGQLTINDEHPNYAVVSGIGKLRGRPYSHMTRIYSEQTGADVAENVISVENETLVSLINSANVLKRLKNYYSVTHEASFGLYLNGEETGRQYNFTDPFGDTRNGFIKEMNISLSTILKAETTLAIDFVPGPFGASINQYDFITSSGTWTVPAGSTTIDLIISGGGQGGRGGYDGEDGTDGDANIPGQSNDGHSGVPGFGGNGGKGGDPGKITTARVNVSPGDVLTINIGAGGAGGTHGETPTYGSDGGDTTVTVNGTTYSSANGTIPINGYTNPISGEGFNYSGDRGTPGGDGGSGWAGTDWYSNADGEDVTYQGVTYNGGVTGNTTNDDGIYQQYEWYNYAEGGGGGGAAAGQNGYPGSDGVVGGRLSITGGDGANGADAILTPPKAPNGNGGAGGNGGGGGGGGGGITADWEQPRWNTSNLFVGHGGSGGSGSNGGQGGDGWVIIYYKTA